RLRRTDRNERLWRQRRHDAQGARTGCEICRRERSEVDPARILVRLSFPGRSAEAGRSGSGMTKGPADSVEQQIVDATAGCGISLVASLPDGWITRLITHYEKDSRFRHVSVNREESAIGLCSGAFFSGLGSFALMGASGFLTCIYAITKIN